MTFLFLTGCSLLDPLTDPDIATATLLGVEVPADLDLSASEYGEGAIASAYLANLEGEDLSGSDVALGDVTLDEEGDGVWTTTGDKGLTYAVGEAVALAWDGAEVLRAEAAPPVTFTAPREHTAGMPISIDASDQDFDALLIAVVDVVTGETVWTNAPEDAAEATSTLLGEAKLCWEIPGEVFTAEGAWGLGVAGLRANAPGDVEGVNVLASVMMTGLVTFQPVTTIVLPEG